MDVNLMQVNSTSYGNQSAVAVATALAAAGAGTVNGPDQTNTNARGVVVFINVTAITGTAPTLTVKIQGKDAVSGQYYDILTSAAISTTGLVALRAYPGIAAAANVTANDVIPRDWRVSYTVGGTTPAVTATITAAPLM